MYRKKYVESRPRIKCGKRGGRQNGDEVGGRLEIAMNFLEKNRAPRQFLSF